MSHTTAHPPRRAAARPSAARAAGPGRSHASGRSAVRRRARRSRVLGLLRLALLLLVLFLVVWAGTRVAQAAGDDQRLRPTVHVVRAGETLWGIVCTQYGTRRHDVRELVYLVGRENDLTGASLYPGQEIRLPRLE